MNRFHLVPYINHRDIHRDGTQLTLEVVHGMPVGVNNQTIPYTLDTGTGITNKQPSLDIPSSSLKALTKVLLQNNTLR